MIDNDPHLSHLDLVDLTDEEREAFAKAIADAVGTALVGAAKRLGFDEPDDVAIAARIDGRDGSLHAELRMAHARQQCNGDHQPREDWKADERRTEFVKRELADRDGRGGINGRGDRARWDWS